MTCLKTASGLNKTIIYKKHAKTDAICYGDLPTDVSGGVATRRVTGTFNLNKETYKSAEIRTDYQVVDSRHGVRSVDGSLSGELSPGSYATFLGSALCKDFAAPTAPTAPTSIAVNVASVGDSFGTVTLVGGNFYGIVTVGSIIRLSGMTNSANNGVNLLVMALGSTTTTVTSVSAIAVNGQSLVNESAKTGATYSVIGKESYIPTTGHTDDHYTVEQWYDDLSISEVFVGCKINTVAVNVPANGLATVDFAWVGKDLAKTGSTRFLTNPTAQSSTKVYSSATGVLLVDGVPQVVITGAKLNINRGLTQDSVAFANTKPNNNVGTIMVDGEITTLMVSELNLDAFDAETNLSLVFLLAADSSKTSDFITFALPKVTFDSATRDDGAKTISETIKFTAVKGVTGAITSTLIIRDSQA